MKIINLSIGWIIMAFLQLFIHNHLTKKLLQENYAITLN